MNRFKLAMLPIILLLGLGTPAFAAPNPTVSYDVGVCDPSFPLRCIKPAADGSIAVSGSLTPSATPTTTVDVPSAAATSAITPVASNAASTLLGKASAGNLYTAYLTASADSWLYVFNSTTAPVNGAVTAGAASGNYQDCIKVATGTTASIGVISIPERFSSGIYLAISSTACGTLTLATTGFLHALVQ